MFDQRLVCRLDLDIDVIPAFHIGAGLGAGTCVSAIQGNLAKFRVEGLCGVVGQIVHQRFFGFGIAQVIAVGPDQIRRIGAVPEMRHVADLTPIPLTNDAVDQGIEKRRVGLGFDRNPFRRDGAGNRQMRFDLNALHAAHPGIGMTPDARDTARRVAVMAAGDDVVTAGRVRGDDKGAVPQLAVKMFRVIAFDALAGTEAEIDLTEGRQQRREGAHILGRRSTAAEAGRDFGIAGRIGRAVFQDVFELIADGVQRLVPGNRHEPRVMFAALLRVGAFHRALDAVRIIGLLDQPIGFHATPPAAGMLFLDIVVGGDSRRDAVLDLDIHQIGPRDALVAEDRNLFLGFGFY